MYIYIHTHVHVHLNVEGTNNIILLTSIKHLDKPGPIQ